MNIHRTLKFLFPEYQIVETAKKYGFVAKGDSSQVNHTNVRISINNNQNQNQNQALQIKEMSMGSLKQANKTSVLVDKGVNSKERKVRASGNKLENSFENAREAIEDQFVGQKSAINNILTAFERPFVAGIQMDMPKNTLIVIGKDGIGKNTLINTTIIALKDEKLLSNSTVSKVNLSLYPTQSEKSLFLSDVYQALYAKTDVVVFENMEKCHPSVLGTISDFVINGKHRLSARYAMQNNHLVEATGVLMQNLISEISANNKYFIFSTQLTESQISDLVGLKFMASVADIITFEPYSDSEIREIVQKMLLALGQRCKSSLAVELKSSEAFIDMCASKYKKVTGFAPVEKFIEKDIYRALSEYKLRNAMFPETEVLLDFNEGSICARLTANDESITVDLTDLLPTTNSLSYDEIKKELSQVIGLTKVKEYVLDLENNLKVQQMREDAGHKNSSISMHMIFTGNPGTGKTTIARIVAKYLKSIGILSTGQLREVSRADLVGQYVGHTAKLTNEVIQSALGGVLFIDEAYALCRDKNDIFGLEAIDALVKAIEDYRHDLVVIMAGYKDEMESFLKTNSGLKSRFPNIINFEDYTAIEMVQIADITAGSKGYKLEEDCKNELLNLFERSQIKGRNDSGNGRLVRNIIEAAIVQQSKRIIDGTESNIDLLRSEDFNLHKAERFDINASLGEIIGLENVKDFVRTQYAFHIANEKRRKAGIKIDTTQSLNMIFTGNPGTGKTTIARIVASMLRDMGMLKSGHLIETDRGGLVAEYAGQTASKTEEVFKGALGGILFIDEAYSLSNESGGFGKEAIETLVKLIEDYRGEIVVILAGYQKEMADFMKSNSGLESRFPLVIDFPDYKSDELYKIALKMISDRGFSIIEDAKSVLKEQVEYAHKISTTQSGNGRMMRNMIEKIMLNQSERIAAVEDISKDELSEITSQDIEAVKATKTAYDIEKSLSAVVGLPDVKNYVRSLNARLRIQSERKKMGLPVDNTQTLHMIFKGNPGTGKTMIARTIADVLYNIGVIKTNKLIETDRSGLVAGYVGQTALKTAEVVAQAMDGVLFIDEAYSLAQGGVNDFGKEAIDTLVKLMDDNRERLVVILAGYSQNMDDFLEVNPGLKSRFPNIIDFQDYTVAELMTITENLYASKGYELSDSAKSKLLSIFGKAIMEKSFGNGRYARNLLERSINKQSLRLSHDTDLTRAELSTIEADDIEAV